jgi:hypothetical protein
MTHNELEITQTIGALDRNYGHYGIIYSDYLMTNYAAILSRATAIHADVTTHLKPTSEERFWVCTVAVTLLAAEIANAVIGRPIFHPPELRAFLFKTFHENREWVKSNIAIAGTITDADRLAYSFLDAHINNQLVTDTVNRPGAGRPKLLQVLAQPPDNAGKGNPVHIHWSIDPPLVRFSEPALREHVKDTNGSLESVAALIKYYNGTVIDRVDMLSGIKLKSVKARVKVIEIKIATPDHPLYDQWASRRDPNTLPAATQVSEAMRAQDSLPEKALAQAAKDVQVVQDALAQRAKSQQTHPEQSEQSTTAGEQTEAQ